MVDGPPLVAAGAGMSLAWRGANTASEEATRRLGSKTATQSEYGRLRPGVRRSPREFGEQESSNIPCPRFGAASSFISLRRRYDRDTTKITPRTKYDTATTRSRATSRASHRAKRHPAQPSCIILRGPLGAGKTTIARALARRLGGRVVSIDSILDTMPWDGGSLGLFLRANRVAVRQARVALAKGKPVIFDGNFYWKTSLNDLLRRLPVPCAIFRLEVPLSVCIARDKGRPYSHGESGARAVYAKVQRVPIGRKVDGRGSVAGVVGRILRALR